MYMILLIGSNYLLPTGISHLHFTELRQKVRLYIHDLVLLRGLPSSEGKHELFVKNIRKTVSPTWVRHARKQ